MNRLSLADFVRRLRREKHWSCQDISARAKQKGFQISTTYVTRIENGEHRNPSAGKLTALAAGLEVFPAEIFAIARGESLDTPTARESNLLDLFRHLPRSSQEDLLLIARCFYERRPANKKKNAD